MIVSISTFPVGRQRGYTNFFWAEVRDAPQGWRDLSSPIRVESWSLKVKARSPDHWTASKILKPVTYDVSNPEPTVGPAHSCLRLLAGGTSPRYGRGRPPAVPCVPAGLPQGLALRAGAGPAAARGRQAVHIAPGLSRLLELYPWAAVPAAALRIPLPKGCALGGPGAPVGDALRL